MFRKIFLRVFMVGLISLMFVNLSFAKTFSGKLFKIEKGIHYIVYTDQGENVFIVVITDPTIPLDEVLNWYAKVAVSEAKKKHVLPWDYLVVYKTSTNKAKELVMFGDNGKITVQKRKVNYNSDGSICITGGSAPQVCFMGKKFYGSPNDLVTQCDPLLQNAMDQALGGGSGMWLGGIIINPFTLHYWGYKYWCP